MGPPFPAHYPFSAPGVAVPGVEYALGVDAPCVISLAPLVPAGVLALAGVSPPTVAARVVAALVSLLVALHVTAPVELPLTYPHHVVVLDLLRTEPHAP